jgi:hypothetical protein
MRMNIVDLLTRVIVVAVLLAGALGAFVYAAYRFRRTPREGPGEDGQPGSWFFVRYRPEGKAEDR